MNPSFRRYAPLFLNRNARRMATSSSRAALSHIERTAKEPRDNSIHQVVLTQIDEINDKIRLLRLSIPKEERGKIKFLPGQWIDLHIPGLPKPGGFTITSPPHLALFTESNRDPYIELAIQRSPTNPPAAHLFLPIPKILNSVFQIRIGGSFIWPPPSLSKKEVREVRRVVFVAGGVGVNPLVSILGYLREVKLRGEKVPPEIVFMYSVRDDGNRILFLERLANFMGELDGDFKQFLTGGKGGEDIGEGWVKAEVQRRRIRHEDILDALGPVEGRGDVVVYVCGVPGMTDEFVDVVQKAEGMDARRVLFERWW